MNNNVERIFGHESITLDHWLVENAGAFRRGTRGGISMILAKLPVKTLADPFKFKFMSGAAGLF